MWFYSLTHGRNRTCWREALMVPYRSQVCSTPNHWWRLRGQGRVSLVAQLIICFSTNSHVVQRPCCPYATAFTRYSSCPILATSETKISFLSFLLDLDQRLGGSPHSRPAHPVWILPAPSWCCSLLTAFCTFSLPFPFSPHLEFLSSITNLAFSCLYPGVIDW